LQLSPLGVKGMPITKLPDCRPGYCQQLLAIPKPK